MKTQQEREKEFLNQNLPYNTPYIDFSMKHALMKAGKFLTSYLF